MHEEAERSWGREFNGQFSGMVGQLQREEVDLCTMSSQTAPRLQVILHARAYFPDLCYTNILVEHPRKTRHASKQLHYSTNHVLLLDHFPSYATQPLYMPRVAAGPLFKLHNSTTPLSKPRVATGPLSKLRNSTTTTRLSSTSDYHDCTLHSTTPPTSYPPTYLLSPASRTPSSYPSTPPPPCPSPSIIANLITFH
ncbi:hypothetical protein Pcinc_004011 [Petrolisthes cinctipes]|uniref:Uncharacterized protein n=1 Tax=Petrolisthes cinctipes TaxID=88211 RepID=A0AAE1L1W0_PETCI|nr:hypothetical protein Pcinc_004011 [Petrolisthes cinctipes]